MLDMLQGNVAGILGIVIGIGVVWKYVSKILVILKETQELLNAVIVALSDKKLTKEEIEKIKKEAKDIPKAIKDLMKK